MGFTHLFRQAAITIILLSRFTGPTRRAHCQRFGIFVSILPSLPLLRIDVTARADLDLPATRIPGAAEDAGQVVLVHDVAVLCPALLVHLLSVLLLVLGQDQLPAPPVLTAALDIVASAVRSAVGRLRDAEDVTPVVVLEVLLKMEREVARGVGAAGHPRQGGLAAGWAELLRHVLAHLEAAVAAQNPRLEVGDARETGIQEAATVSIVRLASQWQLT